MKPADLFDRDAEWDELTEFADSSLSGLRLAIMYGRRRQGKSYLLRRLADATGGMYHLATEQTEAISVRRFTGSLAQWLGMPAESLAFESWEAALHSATTLMTRQADNAGAARPPLLIIDEFPYLVRQTPGLPSILQSLYDSVGPGATTAPRPFRLVLCGSAISVMSDLLSGTRALRGRAGLELRVRPLDFREAREFWQIESVRTAFLHNALIGGTPGYRDLVVNPKVPEDPSRFGDWVIRNVLRPTAPLFSEADRVVHEDPRIRDTAVYASLMAAIAGGESSPTKLGGLLGRQSSSLTYQLRMLESAGFVERNQDMVLDRRPTLTVAEPVVRFHHLVIEPFLADLEAGRADDVWDAVAHTLESKILGPHFEAIARDWVVRYASDEAGLHVGTTGMATVPCRDHKNGHEVDVLSLSSGERPRTRGAGVAFIGEAKERRNKAPGVAELHRLEHVRELLSGMGYDTSEAVLGMFSSTGFSGELAHEAAKRADEMLLVGLDDLYGVGAI